MIDLTALTSPGVLRAGLSERFDTGVIDRLTRESGAGMAILYADWFKEVGGVPASWTALATWRIADNVVCGRDTVTFYAVDVACRENLLARLKRYEPSLPPWVRVSYLPGTN